MTHHDQLLKLCLWSVSRSFVVLFVSNLVLVQKTLHFSHIRTNLRAKSQKSAAQDQELCYRRVAVQPVPVPESCNTTKTRQTKSPPRRKTPSTVSASDLTTTLVSTSGAMCAATGSTASVWPSHRAWRATCLVTRAPSVK